MAGLAVLDTNIILYHLTGRLAAGLPEGTYLSSIITEMELLSFPGLGDAEERVIQQFLRMITVVGLTPTIKDLAITLRRSHNLKLPDAIIAATAVANSAELFSNDSRFGAVPGLNWMPLPVRIP